MNVLLQILKILKLAKDNGNNTLQIQNINNLLIQKVRIIEWEKSLKVYLDDLVEKGYCTVKNSDFKITDSGINYLKNNM